MRLASRRGRRHAGCAGGPTRRARIIFIAEKHDEASHHRLQNQIIRCFTGGNNLTVGMEMIDVTQQAALDDYAGRKSVGGVCGRTFDRGWEGPHRPTSIISWCRRNGVQSSV
jgi:hypothetical protein